MTFTLFEVCLLIVLSIVLTVIIYHVVDRRSRLNNEASNEHVATTDTDVMQILLQDNIVEKINTLLDTHIINAANNYLALTVDYSVEDAYINSKNQEEMSAYIFLSVKKNMTSHTLHLLSLIYKGVDEDEEELDKLLNFRIKMYMISEIVKINT